MKAIAQAAQPAVFTFNDAHEVRVESDAGGAPWFCAKDVCAVLGHTNTSVAVKQHCRPKGVTQRYPLTAGGRQGLTFIDEGNLYRLILKSRLPAAQAFESWVCDQVLPALRKTGLYVTPAAGGPPNAGGEALSAVDMANLRRAVWRIAGGMNFGECWTRTVWAGLRKATGVHHPHPFLVDHLPLIETELRAMCHSADTVRKLTDDMNRVAMQLVASGAGVDAVVAAMRRAAAKVTVKPDPLGLRTWTDRDLERLLVRGEPVMDHPEAGEA